MSSPNKIDQLLEDYVSRIHHTLRDLPQERRDLIVEDIREHIRTARAAMESENEAQIRQLLDDLGDPEAIRSEAGLPPFPELGWGDRWAPWLLLLGGFVFMLGWLAGVALLWQSTVWKLRDKLMATLIWPGGLAAVVYALGLGILAPAPAGITRCTGGPGGTMHCTRPTVNHLLLVLAIIAMVLATAAPIVVNIRLIRIRNRFGAR